MCWIIFNKLSLYYVKWKISPHIFKMFEVPFYLRLAQVYLQPCLLKINKTTSLEKTLVWITHFTIPYLLNFLWTCLNQQQYNHFSIGYIISAVNDRVISWTSDIFEIVGIVSKICLIFRLEKMTKTSIAFLSECVNRILMLIQLVVWCYFNCYMVLCCNTE